MKRKNYPASSLIISTYNWPEALACCLKSVLKQTWLPDEVIIADDGSTDETRALVESYRRHFPVPLIHVWQPDEGFQLARIRNKAIAKATHDYIIQIDGDLILHPKFIKDHLAFAKPGHFATGSRVMLDARYSERLLSANTASISLFHKGVKNRNNGIRATLLTRLYRQYRRNDIFYLRGCNMAFWKKDLIDVNGYNEALYGWGREDNELAARLINLGRNKRAIKHSAIVFHIYHTEKDRNNVAANNEVLQQSISEKLILAPFGIRQYVP